MYIHSLQLDNAIIYPLKIRLKTQTCSFDCSVTVHLFRLIRLNSILYF